MRGVQVGKDKHDQFLFEMDMRRFANNRTLYKNIRPKEENCTFMIYKARKYYGSKSRLSDAVEFRDSVLG